MQLLAKDTNFCGDLHFHRWILFEQGVLWVSMFQRKTSLSQCCFEKRMCFDAGGASIKCWDRTEVGIFASEQGWYRVWVSSGDTWRYCWRCSCQLFTRQIRSMQPSRRFVEHLRQGYSRWNLDIPKATWSLIMETTQSLMEHFNPLTSDRSSWQELPEQQLGRQRKSKCKWPASWCVEQVDIMHVAILPYHQSLSMPKVSSPSCEWFLMPAKLMTQQFFDSKKSNWTVTKTPLV